MTALRKLADLILYAGETSALDGIFPSSWDLRQHLSDFHKIIGVPRNFFGGGGGGLNPEFFRGVQQIGDLGAVVRGSAQFANE
jgi:hypothetical protein